MEKFYYQEKAMIEHYPELIKKIYEFARDIAALRGTYINTEMCFDEPDYDQSIAINKDNIKIIWREYRHGDYDYEEITFPTSYLFDNDWMVVEREVLRREKR